MYLLVTRAGRYWRFDYRYGGKRRTLALGVYPEVGLAAARRRLARAHESLGAGDDPSQIKQARGRARKIATANSFEVVAGEWLQQKAAAWVEVTLTKARTHLETYMFPKLGSRPISEIRAPELLDVLRPVERRAAYTATRLREMAGQIFRYAIATGRADYNPAADLRGALRTPKVTHRPAITERRAFGAFLRDLKAFGAAEPITLLATRFAMLSLVRSQELRHARGEEFDFDAAEWKVPARRMKEGKTLQAHTVPLSPQAIEVLRSLKVLTGRAPHLFPNSLGADDIRVRTYQLYT